MHALLRNVLLLLAMIGLTACGGLNTFHEYARAGDTIALAAGMQPSFSKDNISVTITPSVGAPIMLASGDPAIRTIINLYPDPLSSMIISRETNRDITPYGRTYAYTTSQNFTDQDHDWYQTTLFLDLPTSLPVGITQIEVNDTHGTVATSAVEIISGTGASSTLNSEYAGPLTPEMLAGLTRSPHFTINFQGTTIPHAIEATFTHDPDSTVGGIGKTFVVNPLGYKKNIFWKDDGNTLKAILTPSEQATLDSLKHMKFYVSGLITGLAVDSINAYDIDGNSITGVTATITQSN